MRYSAIMERQGSWSRDREENCLDYSKKIIGNGGVL